MIISIASGKGGVGKTALALLLADTADTQITLVDCDVEEPNCHLFLTTTGKHQDKEVTAMVPQINEELCNGCGQCAGICMFNAIAIAGGQALLFAELCHGCGGCRLKCPVQAISEGRKTIGFIASENVVEPLGFQLLSGVMKIGVASGVPLIKELKKMAGVFKGDVLLDCPPGTACSMVHAVKDSDFCLLVTEPTPFGRHDLEAALKVVQFLSVPAGVIINKSDNSEQEHEIRMLCQRYQLPLLALIPHSIDFAKKYAGGEISDEFYGIVTGIWQKIKAIKTERLA